MTTDFHDLTPEQKLHVDREITMECVDAMITQLGNFKEQFFRYKGEAELRTMLTPVLEQLGPHKWESLKKEIDKFYGV